MEGVMIRSVNRTVVIIGMTAVITGLFLFPLVPLFAQAAMSQEESSKLQMPDAILAAIVAALLTWIGTLYLARRREMKQSRSLIIAFLTEVIYNFSRCVQYYGMLVANRDCSIIQV